MTDSGSRGKGSLSEEGKPEACESNIRLKQNATPR